MMRYLIGVDIGQMVDFTALAIVERVAPPAGPPPHPHEVGQFPVPPAAPARYIVHHLQRFELRTPYPHIVNRIVELLHRPELAGQPMALLLDTTSVGRAILDMFKHANVRPQAITIHGGSKITNEGLEWHVPKKALVFALTSLAQARPVRLALGDQLPFAADVRREMQSFTAKINPETSHESFLAWREADHDDLLLSLAMACWWGEHWGTKQRAFLVPLRY
jgi:hypothetical protein